MMPRFRTVLAAAVLLVAGVIFATAQPASAAGNSKCDTNSPQWNVDICVRTNASRQTDGTGYRLDTVRVWATGDPSTLEDCPAFNTTVWLKKADGTTLWSKVGFACRHTDYAVLLDFGGVKFGAGAIVKVQAQMFDNGDPDPDAAWITLDAVD